MMNEDKKYMDMALALAREGLGATYPNPMVGCVIVSWGEVIGQGYHHRAGQAHAEVNAIESVRDKTRLRESTLYVTLEPCSHFGKTPPCADRIVREGIPRVVVSSILSTRSPVEASASWNRPVSPLPSAYGSRNAAG